MKFIIALFFITILAASFSVKASKYDDCVLDNMKGVTSDAAAKAIMQACYNKYSKKTDTKKTYYQTVCKDYKTQSGKDLDLGDSFWEGDYIVMTLGNKMSHTIYATFLYADASAKSLKGAIPLYQYSKYIQPRKTAVFKIHKRDIHLYAQDKQISYGFEASYEVCNKVKVQN